MHLSARFCSAETVFAILMGAAIILTASDAAAQAATAAQKKDAAPAGNIDNGKKIYVTYGCYECHGRAAQGGTGSGPRLGPNPIAYQAFLQYIRQPKGQMPPYTSKIAPYSELADIHAISQSLPKPPDPKSIPLLNQ